MTVLVLVSMPPERTGQGRVRAEFDLCGTAWVRADALPEAIVEVVEGRPEEILSALERHKPTVVFNACEAPVGRPGLGAARRGAPRMAGRVVYGQSKRDAGSVLAQGPRQGGARGGRDRRAASCAVPVHRDRNRFDVQHSDSPAHRPDRDVSSYSSNMHRVRGSA